jgi:3-isopropylmalate/(R)-2-methylmalate dehydratase large subunit
LLAGHRFFGCGVKVSGIHQPKFGSTGICHTVVREEIAEPGQVILGTDSHTCSAGALNCLAYGIGNTEIACIWEHNEVAGRVPQTVRIRLTGKLAPSCTAKDVILNLAHQGKTTGIFTGKVMEFVGPGLSEFSLEEQAVLSNMAVECNALTAIMEPTEAMIGYLVEKRPSAKGCRSQTRVSGCRISRRSNH